MMCMWSNRAMIKRQYILKYLSFKSSTFPHNVAVKTDGLTSVLTIIHLDEKNAGDYECLSVSQDYHLERTTAHVTIEGQ